MKRYIIFLTITLLGVCFVTGCQKSGNERLYHKDDKQAVTISSNKSTDLNQEKEDSNSTALDVSLIEERIIQEQSFDVELDDWGNVKFISYGPDFSNDFEDVSFFLIKDNKVVYSFPYYCEDNKTDKYAGLFDSVAAVAFRDVNNDNVKDVVAIINYITGAGPQGMMPRPRTRIFLGDKKEFHLATDLIEDITNNMEEKELSIDSICEYLKDKK